MRFAFGVLLLPEMPRMQPRGLRGVVCGVQVVTDKTLGKHQTRKS